MLMSARAHALRATAMSENCFRPSVLQLSAKTINYQTIVCMTQYLAEQPFRRSIINLDFLSFASYTIDSRLGATSCVESLRIRRVPRPISHNSSKDSTATINNNDETTAEACISQDRKITENFYYFIVPEEALVDYRDAHSWTRNHCDDCVANRLTEMYHQQSRERQQPLLATIDGVMRNSTIRISAKKTTSESRYRSRVLLLRGISTH